MSQSDGLVRRGATVFMVLAWLSLVVQVGVGLFILAVGGEPVLIAGLDVPARLVGALNCVSGAIYFFMLLLVSRVLRLLLDIRAQLGTRSAA